MATNPFVKATKEKAFLRLALVGVSGGGKTYSALNIAQHLVPGGKVAVIDTEHGSASKYADLFEFDTVELSDFKPTSYIAMIKAAATNGYDVLIIDSLTHAWDALLAMKDKEAAKKGQNSFTAWGAVNKHYDSLIDAIVGTPIHIIGTIRSKSDYIMEEYIVGGKTRTKPVKVGMKAIHRDGFEYEFDVVAQMDIDNRLIVEKTRCPALTGEVIEKPGAEVAETLRVWLSDGIEPAALFQDDPDNDNESRGEQRAPLDPNDYPRGWPQNSPAAEQKHQDERDTDTGETAPGTEPRGFVPPPPNGDDFPTISSVWPDVASGLLKLNPKQLREKGLTAGGLVYPRAISELGYKDDEDVKARLKLASSDDWASALDALMNRVIELAEN